MKTSKLSNIENNWKGFKKNLGKILMEKDIKTERKKSSILQ